MNLELEASAAFEIARNLIIFVLLGAKYATIVRVKSLASRTIFPAKENFFNRSLKVFDSFIINSNEIFSSFIIFFN